MPVVGTKAAASAQGFGEFTTVSGPATYIEDVFSTWLYTGSGSTQTITNGIDLAGKGGLVWTKARSANNRHALVDTAQGGGWELASNLTNGQNAISPATTFGATGYTMNDSATSFNSNGVTYASWSFRKQPKFFDVVTYTGNGANRTVAHNLGSVPGCIIVKKTSGADNWMVYHRSVAASDFLMLNSTNSVINSTAVWNSTSPTSTVFSVGTDTSVNQSGATYVAYLFAHNAGGFGLTGTDNVISCGSYTGNGSATGPVVTLGYEPQWVLVKIADGGSSNWQLMDTMRGMPVGGVDARLFPNLSDIENSSFDYVSPTATGFQITSNATAVNGSGSTYIYIAIRRGPMKTPTSGTSVFEPLTHAGTSTTRSVSTSFPSDFLMVGVRNATSARFTNTSRLTANKFMWTSATNAETTNTAVFPANVVTSTQNAFTLGDDAGSDWVNASGNTYVDYNFRRAPGFFDEVCWTGNGTGVTVYHNLGVAPELIILKSRSGATDWIVRPPGVTNNYLVLNSTAAVAAGSGNYINNPTATYFGTGDNAAVNTNGATYVAYLFASCPGVSKVGSYSGTGATQTISCGFAARFVLIKRTDSTGNWWVWDTARGMVAGTDPRLPMNAVTIEANANWVYTNASGFQIVTTDATVNASGGTYIYLAIA